MRPVTHTDPDTGTMHRSKVARTSKCGKQTYSSMKLAKATAKHQSKMSGDDIEAYHCYVCHGNHLGHVPGSVRSPKVGDRSAEQLRVVQEHAEA